MAWTVTLSVFKGFHQPQEFSVYVVVSIRDEWTKSRLTRVSGSGRGDPSQNNHKGLDVTRCGGKKINEVRSLGPLWKAIEAFDLLRFQTKWDRLQIGEQSLNSMVKWETSRQPRYKEESSRLLKLGVRFLFIYFFNQDQLGFHWY